MLLSPRVVLFALISVAGVSLAGLFIGYYWFFLRRNAPNQVEPQQVLSVEPANPDDPMGGNPVGNPNAPAP